MGYKFEKLEVWELAVAYVDLMYTVAEQLPRSEDFNLASQLRRASTSVCLNIAEGSTTQSDAEQARFIGLAIRSLVETVACQHLIHRRKYPVDAALLRQGYESSERLFAKLQAFRARLTTAGTKAGTTVREDSESYEIDPDHPVL